MMRFECVALSGLSRQGTDGLRQRRGLECHSQLAAERAGLNGQPVSWPSQSQATQSLQLAIEHLANRTFSGLRWTNAHEKKRK